MAAKRVEGQQRKRKAEAQEAMATDTSSGVPSLVSSSNRKAYQEKTQRKVKHDQGQQCKTKTIPQEDEDEEAGPCKTVWSRNWSASSFGWLVRITPKPAQGKIKTAQKMLLENYKNVLSVESLPTGVCLTLAERRNKYAVSKTIHSFLDPFFATHHMEIKPTDGNTAPLTVAELKYKGLVTTLGEHFEEEVRSIQVGSDGEPFYFNGGVLHVNTDHKDIASLGELEDATKSCAIRFFRLGLNAVGTPLPSLAPLPKQLFDYIDNVKVVAALSKPGLRIAGGGIFAGAHGESCYVQGQVGPDVLAFLQKDEFLHLDGKTLDSMELQSSDPPTKRTRDWQCRPAKQHDGVQADKMQISGALSAVPASGRMNGLGLPQLQMKRVVVWRQVLFKKNSESFNYLKRTGKHLVYNGLVMTKSVSCINPLLRGP